MRLRFKDFACKVAVLLPLYMQNPRFYEMRSSYKSCSLSSRVM